MEEERWLDSGGLASAGSQKTLKVLTLFEGISQNLGPESQHNAHVCVCVYIYDVHLSYMPMYDFNWFRSLGQHLVPRGKLILEGRKENSKT